MTIMSIIITEEDLCKKHAKKCAKICQFSSLPSKCFQAVNDPNTKIDSKPHICAYNYNTRTGFRDHKKIWGSRVPSSTLPNTHTSRIQPTVGSQSPLSQISIANFSQRTLMSVLAVSFPFNFARLGLSWSLGNRENAGKIFIQ